MAVFDHYGQKQGLNESSVKAIVQDELGFYWIGTQKGLFKFDGVEFRKKEFHQLQQDIDINSLYLDEKNGLWVGTRNTGLLYYYNHKFTRIKSNEFQVNSIFEIKEGTNNLLFIATDHGVLKISTKDKQIHSIDKPSFSQFQDSKISAIEFLNSQELMIAEGHIIYFVNLVSELKRQIVLPSEMVIHDLFLDSNQKIWIAASKSLYKYDSVSLVQEKLPQFNKDIRFLEIDQFNNDIWIATINEGLFKIDINSNNLKQYTYQQQKYSLAEKNIMTLSISEGGLLLAGGFSKGLNLLDLNTLNFNLHTNVQGSIECASSSYINSVLEGENGSLWLSSEAGLIKYNPKDASCLNVYTGLEQNDSSLSIQSLRIKDGIFWVSSSKGLLIYNPMSHKSTNVFGDQSLFTFFSLELQNSDLLIGTATGLYKYNKKSETLTLLEFPQSNKRNISFLKFAKNINGDIYLPTFNGLYVLDSKGEFKDHENEALEFKGKDVLDIYIDSSGEKFISLRNEGVYHFDKNSKLIYHYSAAESLSTSTSVYQILADEKNSSLWLASDNGLIYIHRPSKKSKLFKGSYEENYMALNSSSMIDKKGDFYFSGAFGYINFHPNDIDLKLDDSKVLISQLYIMDRPVIKGDETRTGFLLEDEIEEAKELSFSYQDKIISFDFLKINYTHPRSIKYQYKLEPISSDWMQLSANDRNLTFTNLQPGAYTLKVQATGINGEWLNDYTELKLNVHPAPWRTWYAYFIYLLSIVLGVYSFLRRKISQEQKINEYLNSQVEAQTEKIQNQNKELEDLISRKNEIFSNVSHEFRTPITLILGPIEELLKIEQDHTKKEHLNMVVRNSKRLLNLVNQMLKLSKVEELSQNRKEIINLNSRLIMISEPYIFMANKKNITLELSSIADVSLLLTEEALEMSVGNLLSNAIKYTPENGQIELGANLFENQVEIFVKDSGPGMNESDIEAVFKRFIRLKEHSKIQGVGIGLSIVKQVADLNGAELKVESERAKGSKFSLIFDIYKGELENDGVDSNAEFQNIPNTIHQPLIDKASVLIIEDNDDMRKYISNILKDHFHCIVAIDGLDGVKKALKHIPDIVVCDVMMPKMDGYQVSRKLRNEMMTSHIPIVLLTALDEKTSRIKGWRENIDMYLNKPFDAEELILQLNNILKIRRILTNNSSSESLEIESEKLSELDQKFINKLNEIVEAEYANPSLNLETIASKLFVSDRQLQRKTKALIYKSPMDVIRETRLRKAKQSLKKGFNISVTSDTCGFSSVSYFSQTFKKHYSMTPKEYQNKAKSSQNS